MDPLSGKPLSNVSWECCYGWNFQKRLSSKVKSNSKYFISELNKIKNKFPNIIKEIRGKGLILGIQLHYDQTKFIQSLTKNKLLTIRAGENVIRILPPLNVNKNEINMALKSSIKFVINIKKNEKFSSY